MKTLPVAAAPRPADSAQAMNLTIAQPEEPPVEAANADAERAEYVRRVIAARCSELTEAEVAQALNTLSQPEVIIPRDVGQRIETALELIVARLEVIEARLDGRRPH
jgi:hypothetical protein